MMSWVNCAVYTVKKVVWAIMRRSLLFLSCFYMMSAAASAESLPYEVFHFTNSWFYQPIGDFLFLAGQMDSKEGLWKSDGSKNGTLQITENIFSRGMVIDFYNEKLGDYVFFVADQKNNGRNELYIANEADGTNLLIEEFPEPLLTPTISSLKVYKNNFFFYANTYAEGVEMWRTEGAPNCCVARPTTLIVVSSLAPRV